MAAIQPCALLLLVGSDWRVESVSANVAMLGDHRPASVVGQPLAELIGSKAIHTLRNRLAWLARDESEVQDFGVQWGDVTLDVRATRHQESHLIEAELAVEPRLPDGIGMVRSMSDRLSGDDPAALAKQAMIQLGAVTGFENLLLADRGGNAVASNREAGACLRAAPLDITRLIADRDAEPVPLVGGEGSGLLGRAAYLAPDDEQRSELEQSGIMATMGLPLRIDGELVATLHAFNSSPRRCSAERRSVAHLFAERLVARMARQGWRP
jgi:GAF domain-containing protein